MMAKKVILLQQKEGRIENQSGTFPVHYIAQETTASYRDQIFVYVQGRFAKSQMRGQAIARTGFKVQPAKS